MHTVSEGTFLSLRMLVVPILLCGAAQAQGGAVLSGTVTNPGGATVVNATVSIQNLATGRTTQVHTDSAGAYTAQDLAPGDYQVSVAAAGLSQAAKVTLAGGARQTLNLALAGAAAAPGAPSLGDLGFTPQQASSDPREQARLDRRSHMLKTHQRLGLITLAPLIATLVTANGAAGRHGTASGRELHAALGSVTAGLYLTTASFAIFAPKIQGTTARGPIRVHKALAWIHGPGMILTPILGALAYQQRSNGEKVHGIAQAHGAVGIVTAAAYGAAILSVSIKF